MPERYRRQIVRRFEGCSYEGASDPVAEELGERIRAALRSLGYFEAAADDPKMSLVASDHRRKIVDVRVRVTEGAQYRLGEIQFTGAKVFPADRLRAVFEQQNGDVYNATKFGEDFEHLRALYGTAGYAQMVAVPNPMADESRHVIGFTIDIDEGKTYNFGRLVLDGPEPHAGAGQALLDSWKTLVGKRYNPVVLRQWLAANQSNWHSGAGIPKTISIGGFAVEPLTPVPDGESRVVNVKLSFPAVQLSRIESNQRPGIKAPPR